MLKRDIEGLKNDEATWWIFQPVIESVLIFIEKVEEINSVNPEAVTLDNMFNIINENPAILYGINEFENEADQFEDGVDEEVNREMEILDKLLNEGREVKDFVGVLEDLDAYVEPNTTSTEDREQVEKFIGKILGIITSIGIVLSIIISAVLGIKYMLGSVEEKADYKKGMIPYFVGTFLLFGICTLVKILQQFGNAINKI